MAANAFIRSIALGSPDWTPLADAPTVVQATVVADAKNTGSVKLRFRGQPFARWPPGATAIFESVDLSQVEVLGSSGQRVLVAAYAPGDRPRGRSAVRLGGVVRYVSDLQPVGGIGGVLGG